MGAELSAASAIPAPDPRLTHPSAQFREIAASSVSPDG